jgi:hypothetical protein
VDEDRVAGAEARERAVVAVAELQDDLARFAVADLMRVRVTGVAGGRSRVDRSPGARVDALKRILSVVK